MLPLAAILLVLCVGAFARPSDRWSPYWPDPPWSDSPWPETPWPEPRFPDSPHIHESPEPFTLNGYDAIQAVWMIRRAGLLLYEVPGSRGEIIPIRSRDDVRAVHVGSDPDASGPQHRERYDIIVNGEPLDWRNTFVRYGGRMVNLQALFTYRNQTPPEGLRYRLDR